MWNNKGFLSLKLLSAWMLDLNKRITFISKWISNGIPSAVWISGFFFP